MIKSLEEKNNINLNYDEFKKIKQLKMKINIRDLETLKNKHKIYK